MRGTLCWYYLWGYLSDLSISFLDTALHSRLRPCFFPVSPSVSMADSRVGVLGEKCLTITSTYLTTTQKSNPCVCKRGLLFSWGRPDKEILWWKDFSHWQRALQSGGHCHICLLMYLKAHGTHSHQALPIILATLSLLTVLCAASQSLKIAEVFHYYSSPNSQSSCKGGEELSLTAMWESEVEQMSRVIGLLSLPWAAN